MYPQQYDLAERELAEELNAAEPAWLVYYRMHGRRFCAIACRDGVADPVLEATDVSELRALMRDAELVRAPAVPPQGRRGW
ncbi:hypothetical protein DQ384_34710 [Sphaerisporangium album]|uniref:Uncharacterized protein n=1 Tax=Sphaerisporangium album TaxID=509200 RepID=A0A367EZZ2_9ACTN|nr:hypothetical protein [Sphaerisporangium album]RCG22760.1 hypothetical protein DQ384_34710 [Sphaerisporangium album]